jgi:hypothetical protein
MDIRDGEQERVEDEGGERHSAAGLRAQPPHRHLPAWRPPVPVLGRCRSPTYRDDGPHGDGATQSTDVTIDDGDDGRSGTVMEHDEQNSRHIPVPTFGKADMATFAREIADVLYRVWPV